MPRWRTADAAVLVGTLGFLLIVLQASPLVLGADAYLRLAHCDEIVVLCWPPLLQIIICLWSKISGSLLVIRCVCLALATLACFAGYRFAAALFGRRVAIVVALWLCTNPVWIAIATMPYQEPLALLLLWLAVGFLNSAWRISHVDRAHFTALVGAAFCANLLCLTRYEGWLLPVALAMDCLGRSFRVRGGLAAVGRAAATFMLYGGGPIVLWLILGPGLERVSSAIGQSGGLPAVPDAALTAAGLLWRCAAAPVVAFAAIGAIHVYRTGDDRRTHLLVGSLIPLMVASAWLTDSFSPGNPRQILLPCALALPYAAHGLNTSARWAVQWIAAPRRKGAHAAAVAVVGGLVAVMAARTGLAQVEQREREPTLRLAYAIGLWLGEEHRAGTLVYMPAKQVRPGKYRSVLRVRSAVYAAKPTSDFRMYDAREGPVYDEIANTVATGRRVVVIDDRGEQGRLDRLQRTALMHLPATVTVGEVTFDHRDARARMLVFTPQGGTPSRTRTPRTPGAPPAAAPSGTPGRG